MGVNRFDTPAGANFINTHVPIPFQELAQAAAIRQGKADEVMGRLDDAQIAATNISYIPNSPDQVWVEGVQTKLANFADEFIDKDGSDPEVYRKIKRGLKGIANPNQVKAVQESRAAYDVHQKMAAQMQSRGEQVYNPYDFSKHDTLGGSGVFTGMPTMDLGAQAEQAIDKFMTKPQVKEREVFLKKSGRWGMQSYRDINDINSLIDSGEFGQLINNPAIQQLMEKEGLDEAGFKQHLSKLAPNYEQTKTGNLFSPEYEEVNPYTGYPAFEDAPAVIDTGYGGEKKREGAQRRAMNKAVLVTEDIIPGLVSNKEDRLTIEERQKMLKSKDDAIRELNKKYWGLKKNASSQEEKSELNKQEQLAIAEIKKEYKESRDKEVTLEFESDDDKKLFNDYLSAASEYYNIPEISTISSKDKVEKIDDYLKHRQQRQRHPEVLNYAAAGRPTDVKVIDTQNQIAIEFGALTNRAVYDPDLPKDQNLMTTRAFMDDYPPGKDAYTWNLIGETNDIPRVEMASSKQVEIRDKDGKHVKTVYIGGAKTENPFAYGRNTMVRNMLYNEDNNYLPYGTFTLPAGEGEYTVDWTHTEKEQTKDTPSLSEYEVTITDEFGKKLGPFVGNGISEIIQLINREGSL